MVLSERLTVKASGLVVVRELDQVEEFLYDVLDRIFFLKKEGYKHVAIEFTVRFKGFVTASFIETLNEDDGPISDSPEFKCPIISGAKETNFMNYLVHRVANCLFGHVALTTVTSNFLWFDMKR